MKILLVGHPGSQHIVPVSKYLTSKYLSHLFDIKYLNYKGAIEDWGKFVISHLFTLEDDHVIFALDDYLINRFYMNGFIGATEAMSQYDGKVGVVKLCNSSFEEHDAYPVTTQYSIWDRKYLISILEQIRTPWEFEIKGSEILKYSGRLSLLRPCVGYNTSSALSSRWEGIDFKGVKTEDMEEMRKLGILADYKPQGEMPSMPEIVVFGGSGFLGHALIDRLVDRYDNPHITVVARNEGELVRVKQRFPNIDIMVGDIADPWVVKKAMAGADQAFHLAAMKHVGLAESDVKSCVNTNVIGAMNIINESLITKPKALVFISSDKAAQSTGVYGCSKKIGERLMVEAEKANPDTKYRVIRYGNVWNSTGSIATKWKPKMEKSEEVIITDRKASRFFWTVEEAVDLIFECMEKATSAEPYIPKMKAVTMGTVLDACMEVWGRSPVKEIGLQPGENLAETTDGLVFSDKCEQFSKEEFKQKFLYGENTHHVQQRSDGSQSGLPMELLALQDVRQQRQITSSISGSQKVTAILITREKEYPKLVEERLDTGFFDEIIVVTECNSIYNRYLAAAKATHQIVYVQDDDCMVNYQELFKHYNGQITNAMPKDFIEKYKDTGVTLVGWGCYFPKSMLLNSFEKYIGKYGVDSHLIREADRIFTYFNQPFNTVVMPHEDIAQTEDRMCYQPEHYTSAAEAIEKTKSLLTERS
jgi:UDP-N-acetylglucosamine 4,6-dehydratase